MIKIKSEKETIRISENERPYMAFEIDRLNECITILTQKNRKEFIFKSDLSFKTLQRWEKVAKLLLQGIKYIKTKEYGKK